MFVMEPQINVKVAETAQTRGVVHVTDASLRVCTLICVYAYQHRCAVKCIFCCVKQNFHGAMPWFVVMARYHDLMTRLPVSRFGVPTCCPDVLSRFDVAINCRCHDSVSLCFVTCRDRGCCCILPSWGNSSSMATRMKWHT